MQKQKLSMKQKWLFTIQRKRNTIKIYKNTKLREAQYDKDKAAYDQLVAEEAEEDAAKAQYEADLAKYNVEKITITKMIILLIKEIS